MMSDGGKGSAQRPRSIADEEWSNRWDAIFGRDKPKQPEEQSNDKVAEQDADRE
jgi:hypothetical protein